MNQTPRKLMTLLEVKVGLESSCVLVWYQQPQRWQGPFGISAAGLFPPGAPITLMNQTPRVLVALVVGNNGAVSNFFLDLDQQPQRWQGPFGMSAGGLVPAGALGRATCRERVEISAVAGSLKGKR